MLRSVVANDEKSDYKKIWDESHVEKVIASFKEHLPEYLEGLYTEDEEELEGLAKLGNVKKKEPTTLQQKQERTPYISPIPTSVPERHLARLGTRRPPLSQDFLTWFDKVLGLSIVALLRGW